MVSNNKLNSSKEKRYLEYVNEKSPNTNIFKNVVCAFISGGMICVLGQLLKSFYQNFLNMDKETIECLIPMTLIFLSTLFTGLNFYDKLAKHAGAGTLVPITGFANSIVSPAMEFKKEGFILGVGSKMFVIAGPVLIFGIISSIIVGFVYLIIQNF
jgi:stage V sporulation protein AC